jgi:hypothetical protein
MKNIAVFALLACGCASFGAVTARAQFTVSAQVSQSGAGYAYSYSATNTGPNALVAFSVEVGIAPASIATPQGWQSQTIVTQDRRLVQWVASSHALAIAPGGTLAGFSIESASAPGTIHTAAIDDMAAVYDEVEAPGPAYFPSQLANIATRMSVGSGNNVLIGGFIITGTQNKAVIVRGIGPSLPVPGALADPVIEVHGSAGELLASNDNWGDALTSQQILDSGLAPTNELESALYGVISPGAYTVIVRERNDSGGIGLFEVYDLERTVDSKLGNVATRGFVDTGDNVMIGGTIILGDASARVLLRAIGPSLANFGVSNALADPRLELHDGNGALIGSNDNWRSDHESEIIATGIPPTNDLESAILQTLPPGAYTAIVAGHNNLTGVALVEAYQLP